MSQRVNDRTLYMRAWREKNRAKHDAYMAEWKKAHKAEVSLYNKLYRQAHKKEHAARNAQWKKRHPERAKALDTAQRAMARYPGQLRGQDVLDVIARCGTVCHWCGKRDLQGEDLTLEHLQPVNDVAALVVACFSCNAARIAMRTI